MVLASGSILLHEGTTIVHQIDHTGEKKSTDAEHMHGTMRTFVSRLQAAGNDLRGELGG